MRRAALAAVLAAAVTLLAASFTLPAAAQGIFDDNVARGRIEDLRKQLDATAKALEERRGDDRRALVELASQIEALRGEIARMRGQLEVLQNQGETTDKRSKDLYVDVDSRLRKLEQVKEVAVEKPPAEVGPSAAEVKAYESALNLFKAGNYPLAVSAFQLFLYTYPNSKLAPNAQYWMGNTQSAQGQYKMAIGTQQKLVTTWPEDPKAPDALAAIAKAQEDLGDRRSAQKTIDTLLARYPQSPAAASAKQRMQQGTKR